MDGFDVSQILFNTEMMALVVMFAIFLWQNNQVVKQSKKIAEDIVVQLGAIDKKATESTKALTDATQKAIFSLENMDKDAREWRTQSAEDAREFRNQSAAEHREILGILQRTYEQSKIHGRE